jgi:hypothetical protein
LVASPKLYTCPEAVINQEPFPLPSGITVTAAPAQPPIEGQEPLNLASPKAKSPPSEATRKYPPPSLEGTMPTMGAFRFLPVPPVPAGAMLRPGMEPKNPASPKLKIPLSEATNQ